MVFVMTSTTATGTRLVNDVMSDQNEIKEQSIRISLPIHT